MDKNEKARGKNSRKKQQESRGIDNGAAGSMQGENLNDRQAKARA
jgi:hypothetical protein